MLGYTKQALLNGIFQSMTKKGRQMRNITSRLIRKVKFLLLTPAERRHSMVGPPRLWKMKRDFQIQFLKQVGLQPQHYLLDIGCGTLRGGIPIIQYLEKGHYFCIESRREVLEEGRKELQKSHLEDREPMLIAVENISMVNVREEFDFIWAFSVLIHMTDEILNDCLSFVETHLKRNGCFYANINIGDKSDGNWQGFPFVYRSFEFYKEACSRSGLRLCDMGLLKNFGHLSGIKAQDEQRMLKICKS